MSVPTKTFGKARLDVLRYRKSAKSRIMILRSFVYTIADGQEKPKCDEKRTASRKYRSGAS